MRLDGTHRLPQHEPKVDATGLDGRRRSLLSCLPVHRGRIARYYLQVKILHVEALSPAISCQTSPYRRACRLVMSNRVSWKSCVRPCRGDIGLPLARIETPNESANFVGGR